MSCDTPWRVCAGTSARHAENSRRIFRQFFSRSRIPSVTAGLRERKQDAVILELEDFRNRPRLPCMSRLAFPYWPQNRSTFMKNRNRIRRGRNCLLALLCISAPAAQAQLALGPAVRLTKHVLPGL